MPHNPTTIARPLQDAAAIRAIRDEMDAAKTSKVARKALAKLALAKAALTPCARAEWLKELA